MSEIKRLREALKEVESRAESIRAYGIRDIASEALSSSHREDGIQKVREEWEAQKAGGNTLICAAIEGTAKALGYTIPGITEER